MRRARSFVGRASQLGLESHLIIYLLVARELKALSVDSVYSSFSCYRNHCIVSFLDHFYAVTSSYSLEGHYTYVLFQYEKEKAEKSVKRVEGERDLLNTELIQARVQLSKAQSQGEDFTKQQMALQEQVEDLQADKERVLRSKQEVSAAFNPFIGSYSFTCCLQQ